jgi:hypothetical protein
LPKQKQIKTIFKLKNTNKMKTVFSNSEICHVFANRTQNEGRTSNRSIFFTKDTIYSYGYHFAIAKFMENEKGTFLLFTTRGYSNTTRKHISLLRYATNHIAKVYCNDPDGAKEDNLQAWYNEAKNAAQKLIRAKKPIIYIQTLQGILNEAEIYCEYLGYELPQNIKDICNITKGEEIATIIEKEKEILRLKEIEKQKEEEREHKKELNKFRKGEKFNIYAINHEKAYLRYNKENNRIETTQNVQIPFEVAKKFYNIIKNNAVNIDNLQILDYKVIELNKEFIQIGCHNIEFKEINKIAKELSL